MCPISMKFGTQNKLNMLIINKSIGIGTLTQNYKYAKFGLETKICCNFYELWHSQQIEHANYEYNTRQCLKGSRDYWLRMIIGSELLQVVIKTVKLPINSLNPQTIS